MSDAFEITNPEILNRIESINNGTLKDIVISGQAREIEAVVTDTLSGGELATIVDGNYEVPINDGSVNFMHYEGTSFTDAPVTSTTAIAKTTPAGPITQYNSNVTAIQRGRVVQPYNATVTDGKVNLSGTPASGSFGANAAYFLGEVNQAVCAAQVGIALGKVIDGALYNANPDFWDAQGMSSLNPETWGSLTHGDDSLGATLFNMVFGINPDTNKGQAYIDQNAFAYMAYYMAQNGFFTDASGYTIDISQYPNWPSVLYTPIPSSTMATAIGTGNILSHYDIINTYGGIPLIFTTNSGERSLAAALIFEGDVTISSVSGDIEYEMTRYPGIRTTRFGAKYTGNTLNGTAYTFYTSDYASPSGSGSISAYTGVYNITSNLSGGSFSPSLRNAIATVLLDGTPIGGLDGVSNQEGATIPDTTGWDNLNDVLASLQNQFPNVWNDSITYNQIQPDGTLKPTTYVPVGWPTTVANPWTDTKPTTDSQPTTQAQPQIDLDTLLDSQTNPLTRTLTQTPTPNPNPDLDVPQNPTDTGDGSSPTPIPPTGSASALWSVYHPTQAQVNAFGAWLWSNDFVDQLLKVFQNPMDAIISLHKVFINPVDAGSTTIHAGYLDSEVPSNYVTQQYVYKDCGYVNCYEVFGNVFDYVGTSVSLYLPFIGIVPLNVDEVMRSTIHVIYGCDLFTGAILVQVEISRDGNDVVMYQYGGDGGVQYPVSGSRSSGFLTGLAATIGAAASIATGGAALPAFAAAFGGSVMSAQKQVQHSGGFSGNSGAMGGKTPYLIIERPQTKVAQLFPSLSGYPTNVSGKLSDFEGQVVVSDVHVEGMTATDTELSMIEDLLKEGVLL